MSAKKPSAKAIKAREEAARQRAEHARAARKRKSAIVSAAVVVIVVVAGAIGYGIYKGTRPEGPAATPKAATSTGGFAYGKDSAPVTMDLYADMQCPACKQFEKTFSSIIDKEGAAGSVKVAFHPIAILDRYSSGSKYSTRGANAVVCVAEDNVETMRKYVTTLYDNQPAENGSGLPDKKLISLAESAGAKSDVKSCIKDGTYKRFVATQTEGFSKRGLNATPSVLLNGKKLTDKEMGAFPQTLDAAIKAGKGAKQ